MKKKRPTFELVLPGVYLANSNTLFVEVIQQDSVTGNIRMEVYGETELAKRFESISTSLFVKLFVKTDLQAVACAPNPKR